MLRSEDEWSELKVSTLFENIDEYKNIYVQKYMCNNIM